MEYIFPPCNPNQCASSSSVVPYTMKEISGINNKKKGIAAASSGKKGKAVKLSTDRQTIAARQRRHRISDRFKILQSLVPGATKMDTVSMLEEAIHYVKYLKIQIWLHQSMVNNFTGDDDPSIFLPSDSLPPLQQTDVYSQSGFGSLISPEVGFSDSCFYAHDQVMPFDPFTAYYG